MNTDIVRYLFIIWLPSFGSLDNLHAILPCTVDGVLCSNTFRAANKSMLDRIINDYLLACQKRTYDEYINFKKVLQTVSDSLFLRQSA